jgi:hypothetical protein
LSAKQTLNEVFHKIFDLNVSSCNKQSFAQQEVDSRSSAISGPFRATKNPALGRFVMFVTTRTTMQGRAGVGLRRDAPAFPGERARFTRLNDEGSDRLRRIATSIWAHRPVSARSDGLAPDIMAPHTYYPLQPVSLYQRGDDDRGNAEL